MKIDYLLLENVAGLKVGLSKEYLEIDFSSAKSKLVSIQGENGVGKTVLLSSLSPFASVTSLDERSSLPYIIPGKNGYKEIHYSNDNDHFVIKHYYKATKDSHSVKSHFFMNGEDLNENGNVTSFLSLVELHFGLTQDMMRLVRLGTNVSSFIDQTPARRKEYIGKLINEIETYMKIYKKINEDIRLVKVLLSSNANNLYNCHISDIVVEEDKLKALSKTLKELGKDRDEILKKINNIESLERENNIDELRKKVQEAQSALMEFHKMEEMINDRSLKDVSVDSLIENRNKLMDQRINIQSTINSYRLTIDTNLNTIDRIQVNIKKITSDNDVQSLINAIKELRDQTNSVTDEVKDFVAPKCTSEEVYQLLTKLTSFNDISKMLHTLGSKPMTKYLELKKSKSSIDSWLKEQLKRRLSMVGDDDIKKLLAQVFQDDDIIMPNCENQFHECPYYRFASVINEFRDKVSEESLDEETLRYIKVIAHNVDNVLNEIDRLLLIKIPDGLKEIMREKSMLDRLSNKMFFYDLSDIQQYLSRLKAYELYVQDLNKLKQYEYQLSIYKNSGIEGQLAEIDKLENDNNKYRSDITSAKESLDSISKSLGVIDENIVIVSKFNDTKKYKAMMENTLESGNRILIPLETSSQEKIQLKYKLQSFEDLIYARSEEAKQLEKKIDDYYHLIEEGKFYKKKHEDLQMILESVSTKKGIPVIFMNVYLGKIQKLANDLLNHIYDGELQLAKFRVTQETFEVPFAKNGTEIPDVKYASQSESALITMALSFALSHRASGAYNILLLDEIDAGLDEKNRSAFLKMLEQQMRLLKSEQVFIISHNLNSMTTIPMDVIKLSDIGFNSKLQNIIYE